MHRAARRFILGSGLFLVPVLVVSAGCSGGVTRDRLAEEDGAGAQEPDDGGASRSAGRGGGTGSSGAGGGAGQCLECFPFGAECLDGVISYRLGWGSACPPSECQLSKHVCALGCRQERVQEYAESLLVFALCEDTSVRGAGFPCRNDVDCATPVGATLGSNLNTDSSPGNSPDGTESELLRCSERGACTAGLSQRADDVGEPCSIETSDGQPGPVVGSVDTCATGACLVLTGGLSEGACTVACRRDSDCPADHGCADVLDNRYTVWGHVAEAIAPPRILACVPNRR